MSTAPELSATPTTIAAHPGVSETDTFRRHIGQISKQSSVFFAGTIFSAAAGYIFKIYLARVLGAEALGIYALGMTIIGFLGIFNGLGLPQSAVRFVSSYSATGQFDRLRTFLGRGTGLLVIGNFLLAGLVLWLGPWVALHVYHTRALASFLHFFVLIMFVGALTTFFSQILAGYKDVTRRTFITNFVGSPCTMLLSVGLLLAGWRLAGYLLAQIVSSVLVLGFLLHSVWRLTPEPSRLWTGPMPRMHSEVFSFSSAVFGIGILEFLLAQADKILIGVYLSAREVGIYMVAAAVVSFVPIALQSVNQIFSPIIADLHARGEHELLQRLFQTLTKWILGLTLPLATTIIIFAAPLMRIFGADFQSAWPVLVIGTLGQLVNCGVGSVGYLLLMAGQQNRLVRVQAAMAILMLVLAFTLIPRWGIFGGALAAAIVNIATNACNLRAVRSSLKFSPYNASYFRLLPPLFATVTTMLIFRFSITSPQPQWALILLCLLVGYSTFFGVALLVGMNGDDQLIAAAVWARARVSFGRLGLAKL